MYRITRLYSKRVNEEELSNKDKAAIVAGAGLGVASTATIGKAVSDNVKKSKFAKLSKEVVNAYKEALKSNDETLSKAKKQAASNLKSNNYKAKSDHLKEMRKDKGIFDQIFGKGKANKSKMKYDSAVKSNTEAFNKEVRSAENLAKSRKSYYKAAATEGLKGAEKKAIKSAGKVRNAILATGLTATALGANLYKESKKNKK